MFNKDIYQISPTFLQNILISSRALIRKNLRENSKSKYICNQLKNHEYSTSGLSAYTFERLNETIINAVNNVPFFSDIELNSIEDFPFISKDDIKKHSNKFKNISKPKLVISGSTSGTTGSPLTIPQPMDSVILEQAFITRMLNWAGFEKGDKRAWIRGDMIVPIKQAKPPFWRYSWFDNMIQMSSFHMTTEALPLYINAMVEYGVDIIQAYPSSIVTLAKYLESKNEFYPGKIKSILTSSESLTLEHRKLIEKRFCCKVFDWYGLFERVAAIANCEHGRYHVLTDYSYVEFLDVGDGRHEIVGTNFNNHYYPLIRYKTGDHVILSKEKECPCGRVYPMVERIEGRVGDFLVGQEGQKVHILNHIPKGVEGLLACQFIQNRLGHIQILVVVDDVKFTDQQKQHLIQNIKDRLGQGITVEVTCVDALPRTKNGKVRQAVCSL